MLRDARDALKERDYNQVSEFIEHREFECALHWFCSAIKETGQEFTPHWKETIQKIAEEMKLNAGDYLEKN